VHVKKNILYSLYYKRSSDDSKRGFKSPCPPISLIVNTERKHTMTTPTALAILGVALSIIYGVTVAFEKSTKKHENLATKSE